jgi:hypothetical protein
MFPLFMLVARRYRTRISVESQPHMEVRTMRLGVGFARGVVGLLAFAAVACPALAFEPGAHPPFLAGSSLGVPIGIIAPAGFYFGSLTTYFEGGFHPDSRPKTPDALKVFTEGVTLTWVPDIEFLGTRYAASVTQTMAVKTVTGIPPRGIEQTKDGLVNTSFNPLNLAWKLPQDFYVSARFSFQPPLGQYDRHSPVNIANNFWALEPNVGVSYLSKSGLDVSVRMLYDIVTANHSSSAPGNVHSTYQSGDIFTGEWGVSQSIEKWRFGIVGFGVQQVHDDSAGGHNIDGTKLSRVGIGPLLEYNASWIGVNLYYTRDVVWHGAAGGNSFFLRATIKF